MGRGHDIIDFSFNNLHFTFTLFLFFGVNLFSVFVHHGAKSKRSAAVNASICIRHPTVNVRMLLQIIIE